MLPSFLFRRHPLKRICSGVLLLAMLGLPLGSMPVLAAVTVLANDAAAPLHEISYYPRNFAWEALWQHWTQARVQMDADLDRIQSLGANTVRIFLQPAALGYPLPSTVMLANFEDALALIAEHGLKVHVNLFDCWESYTDLSGSQTWLNAVVAPHKDDPRIEVWELRNEVGLDQPAIRTWVQTLFPVLKQQAGISPVTVSVSKVEWLDDVTALTGTTPPDIYSLHLYPPDALTWTHNFPAVLDSALQVVPKEKLLIGEFGLSTYEYSDASQADLYNDVLYYASQKGITQMGAWTLNDFPPGTLQCGGYIPRPQEWYFGLYRADGTEKPAAAMLREAFHGNSPTASRSPALINRSFEGLNGYSQAIDNWWPWDEQWTWQPHGVQDATVARSGSCSARLSGPGTMAVGLYLAPALEVNPLLRYSLEAYTRTQNLSGWVRIALSWFDKNEAWLGQTISPVIVTPNQPDWIRLAIDRTTPPPEAAYVQLFVQMNSIDPTTQVWFDDIRLSDQQVYLPLLLR
jgi:hypothetical protein